ncbi:MAG: PAS domain S-box protein [Chitinophagaceae bacterium]|nr:PAS domain S-box protein [Chitinophagaceae bacterium]
MEPSRLALFLHKSSSIYHIRLDIDGRFAYVNELYEKIFFTSPDEVKRHFFKDSIDPDDLESYDSTIESCIDNPGRSVCIDLRRLRADGSSFWIRWEFEAETENGKTIGFQALGTDASERKRGELERQRLVTEATIMAQEKERAEIGRELHDNINQILTTTKMYLDMALTEKDISEELTIKSHENISTAIEEIRILSKSLVPPSLGDIGLKEAVLEMIDNLRYSQKLDIKLKTSGLSKLLIPDKIKLTVFRIIQEQMNNILKHAKATAAEIKLMGSKEELEVIIADNGVGFEPKKRMKGIGLMNITSRAEVHNGDVDILSSPGNGCTLKISIPI